MPRVLADIDRRYFSLYVNRAYHHNQELVGADATWMSI